MQKTLRIDLLGIAIQKLILKKRISLGRTELLLWLGLFHLHILLFFREI